MSHHSHIVVPGGPSGAEEAGIWRDVGVAVHLYDVGRVIGGHTHVYPGVAPAANGSRGPFGSGNNAVTENWYYTSRADYRGMVIGKRILLPLRSEGNDTLERVGKGAEIYLRQGQNFWWIAPQRDVELPADDELFRQRSLPVTLYQVGDPCLQGCWVVYDSFRAHS